MPQPGYESVSLPKDLLDEARGFLKERPHYASLSDFVKKAIRAMMASERERAEHEVVERIQKAQEKTEDIIRRDLSGREARKMWLEVRDLIVQASNFLHQPHCPACGAILGGALVPRRGLHPRMRVAVWACPDCGERVDPASAEEHHLVVEDLVRNGIVGVEDLEARVAPFPKPLPLTRQDRVR